MPVRFLWVLLVLALPACGESDAPACATQIAADLCATPAQPRGAELVQASFASNVSVGLPPAPLAEGRYVLVARGYSCMAGEPRVPPADVRGVLELSGCVLRRTLLVGESAEVQVFELAYAAEGTLALQRRCPTDQEGALQASYGFDGERLELGRLQAVPEPAEGDECETLDAWELR